MNADAMVRLIARREILARLRDRTFIVSTVAMLVLIVAGVMIPLMLQNRNRCPDATSSCSRTRSSPVTNSVTGCSTWIRQLISMK